VLITVIILFGIIRDGVIGLNSWNKRSAHIKALKTKHIIDRSPGWDRALCLQSRRLLSHTSSPFCSGYFGDGISIYLPELA
jgi:hypothetical protein